MSYCLPVLLMWINEVCRDRSVSLERYVELEAERIRGVAVEDGPAELGPLVFISQPGPATAVARSDLSGHRDMGRSPAGSGRPERRGRRVGEVPVVAPGFVELEPLAYASLGGVPRCYGG